tara:strand:- start:300 stop:500 length:201 start_codon:yes stop_codon:yes gene_type:complete
MMDLCDTGQERSKTKIAQRAEDTKDLKFVIASQDKRIDELEYRLSKLESHRLDLPIEEEMEEGDMK